MYDNYLDNPEYHNSKKAFIQAVELFRSVDWSQEYFEHLNNMLIDFGFKDMDTDAQWDYINSGMNPAELFDILLDQNEYWYFSGYQTVFELKPYVLDVLANLKKLVTTDSMEDLPAEFYEYFVAKYNLLRIALFNSVEIEDLYRFSPEKVYEICMTPRVKDIIYL